MTAMINPISQTAANTIEKAKADFYFADKYKICPSCGVSGQIEITSTQFHKGDIRTCKSCNWTATKTI
jgi:NADH pyrophosphatase NudC (nudix superfamily)